MKIMWFWFSGAEESAVINKIPEPLKLFSTVKELPWESISRTSSNTTEEEC